MFDDIARMIVPRIATGNCRDGATVHRNLVDRFVRSDSSRLFRRCTAFAFLIACYTRDNQLLTCSGQFSGGRSRQTWAILLSGRHRNSGVVRKQCASISRVWPSKRIKPDNLSFRLCEASHGVERMRSNDR
jgi:hypothetical protein